MQSTYWSIAYLLTKNVDLLTAQESLSFSSPDFGALMMDEFGENHLHNNYAIAQSLSKDNDAQFSMYIRLCLKAYLNNHSMLELEP